MLGFVVGIRHEPFRRQGGNHGGSGKGKAKTRLSIQGATGKHGIKGDGRIVLIFLAQIP
jgi:hypothetical protein